MAGHAGQDSAKATQRPAPNPQVCGNWCKIKARTLSGSGGTKVAGWLCTCLGLGLALGFGVGVGGGGGVASERARACGKCTAGFITGQIQHECASLTPGMGIV